MIWRNVHIMKLKMTGQNTAKKKNAISLKILMVILEFFFSQCFSDFPNFLNSSFVNGNKYIYKI